VQGLRERAVRARITAAYNIPITSRYAPELLGYKPTYTNFLKKKPRKQGVPRAGRGGGRGGGRARGAGRGGRGPGRGTEQVTEGSSSGPRGIIREEVDRETPERTGLSGEMAGSGVRVVQNLRRRPRNPNAGVVIGSPGAGTSRTASASPQGPPEKRARPNEGDGGRGTGADPIAIPEEGEERLAEAEEEGTHAETFVLASEVPWAPEVRHYSGRLIHHADSAANNIGTAFGLLRSVILPKDAAKVEGVTEDLTGEIAQALLNVSLYLLLFASVEISYL
jgi:hypothetical protein